MSRGFRDMGTTKARTQTSFSTLRHPEVPRTHQRDPFDALRLRRHLLRAGNRESGVQHDCATSFVTEKVLAVCKIPRGAPREIPPSAENHRRSG